MTRLSAFAVKALLGAVMLAVLPGQAFAHTITFGYENAGPGSVTFWYGSYHSHGFGDGPDLEGSLQLVGILGTSYGPTTVPFSLDRGRNNPATCNGAPAGNCTGQPAGLIDGVTNFADPTYGPTAFADVNSWQGVTFSGLAAGDYQFTYIPIASPSAHWAPWSEAVRTGTVHLTGAIVGGTIPEPATMLLTGTGLGLAALRRRRNRRAGKA